MSEFVFFCRLGDENDYLSNWFPTPFEISGVQYPNVESYMMYQKALLMHDDFTAQKILQAKTPAQVKRLGRQVKNFDEQLWVASRFDVVYTGNLAKFQAYPELKSKLLATGNKTLVEASSYDKIYGIGLDRGDPRAKDRQTWQGQNLLGQILMAVRDSLK